MAMIGWSIGATSLMAMISLLLDVHNAWSGWYLHVCIRVDEPHPIARTLRCNVVDCKTPLILLLSCSKMYIWLLLTIFCNRCMTIQLSVYVKHCAEAWISLICLLSFICKYFSLLVSVGFFINQMVSHSIYFLLIAVRRSYAAFHGSLLSAVAQLRNGSSSGL